MPEITILDLLSWEERLTLPDMAHSGQTSTAETWLEREVSWAVTLRASMPILPPLRGGELVILPDRILLDTGVPVEEIVREVANRGATGLIVERDIAAPPSLAKLWAEVIPPDLESDINRVLTEQRGEIYRAGTELGRLLTQSGTAEADVADVLKAAAGYLGLGAAVMSPRDGLLASAGEGIDLVASSLTSQVDGPGWRGDMYAIRTAHGAVLWLGPVPASRRALARLVSERLSQAVEMALSHAVDVRPRGSAREHAIAGLLTDAGIDVAKVGAALGLPSQGSFAVALSSPAMGRARINREIVTMGACHDAAEVDGFAATLIDLTNRPARHAAAGTGAMATRHPTPDALDGSHWIVISEPVTGVDRIPVAARQARYLAALVAEGLLTGGVIRFDRPAESGVFRLLFPLWGSPELGAFSRDTLGELPAKDRRGNLRRTLLAYLESGGSQVEASARLSVHRNTLAYRLRQIADLTGTDPTRPQSHLSLHMALLASVLPPAPAAP